MRNSKTISLLTLLMVAVFALSSCNRPEPINASEIIKEQADRKNPPAVTYKNKEDWLFENLLSLIEEDLINNYTITAVDTPSIEKDERTSILAPNANTRGEWKWISSFFSERLDPAVVRVITEDQQRYEYKVINVDDTAVLFPLDDSSEDIVDPDELRKVEQ